MQHTNLRQLQVKQPVPYCSGPVERIFEKALASHGLYLPDAKMLVCSGRKPHDPENILLQRYAAFGSTAAARYTRTICWGEYESTFAAERSPFRSYAPAMEHEVSFKDSHFEYVDPVRLWVLLNKECLHGIENIRFLCNAFLAELELGFESPGSSITYMDFRAVCFSDPRQLPQFFAGVFVHPVWHKAQFVYDQMKATLITRSWRKTQACLETRATQMIDDMIAFLDRADQRP